VGSKKQKAAVAGNGRIKCGAAGSGSARVQQAENEAAVQCSRQARCGSKGSGSGGGAGAAQVVWVAVAMGCVSRQAEPAVKRW